MRVHRKLALRRIAVTFRPGDAELASLSALAHLFARHASEVAGIFIEDTDLLRAAALPLCLELSHATNVVRPVEAQALLRQMRERASTAERTFAQIAERAGSKWSFRTVRQRETLAVMETARRMDVTVTGAPAGARHAAFARNRVVVVADRSAAGMRALGFASWLADTEAAILRVIVIGRTQPGIARLLERVREFAPAAAEPYALYRPEFRQVLAVARGERPAAVILPIGLIEAEPERLGTITDSLQCPALIVR